MCALRADAVAVTGALLSAAVPVVWGVCLCVDERDVESSPPHPPRCVLSLAVVSRRLDVEAADSILLLRFETDHDYLSWLRALRQVDVQIEKTGTLPLAALAGSVGSLRGHP